MSSISLRVNGRLRTIDVDTTTPLLFVLSDEFGLRGPKFGCGMAQCGACTVILRGEVVRSCVMPVSAVGKDEVTTLEGLGTGNKPHPLQQAFIDEGAAQCGFCLSGVILTAGAGIRERAAPRSQCHNRNSWREYENGLRKELHARRVVDRRVQKSTPPGLVPS